VMRGVDLRVPPSGCVRCEIEEVNAIEFRNSGTATMERNLASDGCNATIIERFHSPTIAAESTL
jgi:hypothetical protein